MTSKSNLVCAGIDDGYLWPFLVSIFSAKVHCANDFRVAVGSIIGGLSDESKRVIQNFSNFLEVPIEIQDFTLDDELQTTDLNIQIYTRLLWLDTLQENFLWLDADTLPLANWDEVFSVHNNDLTECTISAIVDSAIVKNIPNSSKNKAYLAGGESYFNAGIFIGDPLRWQKLKYPQLWREISKSVGDYGFFHNEQDLLNYVLAEDKRLISPDFNAIVMSGSIITQKILHFTGNPKPWHFSETAKRYFISIETLKNSKTGLGAFGGTNWVYEYRNYWRHEEALLDFCKISSELDSEMVQLYRISRRELMNRKDKIKSWLLNVSGRKWF